MDSSIKIYKTKRGAFIVHENNAYHTLLPWDSLINHNNLHQFLIEEIKKKKALMVQKT